MIMLRHEMLKTKIAEEIELLRSVSTKIRVANARLSVGKLIDQYSDYALVDERFAEGFGALIAREEQYAITEAMFTYLSPYIKSETLAEQRKQLDEILLELLRAHGWDDKELEFLAENLRHRIDFEREAREEMSAFTEQLNDRQDMADTHTYYGHFGEANKLHERTLAELRCKRDELEAPLTTP